MPFTTGILIGIGETRAERIEALLAHRATCTQRYGHIQEVIVQNFRAKPDTAWRTAPEPDLDEQLWTIAVARLILGPTMTFQAPPNLTPGVYQKLIAAGHQRLGRRVAGDARPRQPGGALAAARRAGAAHRACRQGAGPAAGDLSRATRATPERWLAPARARAVLRAIDAEGLARDDDWAPGAAPCCRSALGASLAAAPIAAIGDAVVERAIGRRAARRAEIVRLFAARGADFEHVCAAADELRAGGQRRRRQLRRQPQHQLHQHLLLPLPVLRLLQGQDARGAARRALRPRHSTRSCAASQEAWERGATEVCLQGGIHPGLHRRDLPRHLPRDQAGGAGHARPRLLAAGGDAGRGDARACRCPISWRELKDAGLGTLPGTAAEILDDEVRAIICPDKVNTAEWLEVMRAGASRSACAPPSTIMYGHVERPSTGRGTCCALRDLQERDRRLHRVRAAALRAHGGADVPARPGAQRPDLARGGADARGRAARAAPADPQHPGLLGEDGAGRRGAVPERRRQRPRRHADEREHLARRRRAARPGVAARGDGGADPLDRPHAGAARHALSAGAGGAARASFDAPELAPVVQTPPRKVLAGE